MFRNCTPRISLGRIQMLDILREQAENDAETAAQMFDIELTILGGELSRLLDGLGEALGGIALPEDKDDLAKAA